MRKEVLVLTQRAPVAEMRNIKKVFLDVVANEDVNLSLFPGEICGLLGENGAGKTTLMNVLFGYYNADGGEILIDGASRKFKSPLDAIRCGIGMVHQHFTLVPAQSVLENIIVGGADEKFFLDMTEARKKVSELQERFGLHVDLDAKVWSLPVGGKQKVEILKALYRNARILILDEPTAVLSPPETKELFATLRTLTSEGCSIVFISHKLYEVSEICDRVLVLRHGRVMAERKIEETDACEMANLMVGREVDEQKHSPSTKAISTAPILEVKGVTAFNDKGICAVNNISFEVYGGEVFGIAGVSGNGQRELAEVLFGIKQPSSGEIIMNGSVLPPGKPYSRVEAGMARVPEDRMTTGLLLELSVEDNLILENHKKFLSGKLLNYKAIGEYCDRVISEFGVKTPSRRLQAQALSGGNLQKLILARGISSAPSLMVAAQPTRGLDVGAIEYIHSRIRDVRDSGAAVLLMSEDLDEVFALSDRIAVIYSGSFMGIVTSQEAKRDQIGLWMSGVKDKCA